MAIISKSFFEAARIFSQAAETYQSTEAGARQFELRYLVRDLFVDCSEREAVQGEIFALGADLRKRIVDKWTPKMAIGKLKPNPERVSTREELLEKAGEYARHWNSFEHQAAFETSKAKGPILEIQVTARSVFEQDGSLALFWHILEGEGFSKTNEGDLRLYGRLENLFSQWEAGNLGYNTIAPK